MYSLQHISMFMRNTNTLVCDYGKVQKKRNQIGCYISPGENFIILGNLGNCRD